MRYYETLYIVNPNLENEALDITMGEIGTELEKSKSNLEVWEGERKMVDLMEEECIKNYTEEIIEAEAVDGKYRLFP